MPVFGPCADGVENFLFEVLFGGCLPSFNAWEDEMWVVGGEIRADGVEVDVTGEVEAEGLVLSHVTLDGDLVCGVGVLCG